MAIDLVKGLKRIFYIISVVWIGFFLYKADFLRNYLVGFIKNKYSWHSVEPINVHEGYVRKSININVYY